MISLTLNKNIQLQLGNHSLRPWKWLIDKAWGMGILKPEIIAIAQAPL